MRIWTTGLRSTGLAAAACAGLVIAMVTAGGPAAPASSRAQGAHLLAAGLRPAGDPAIVDATHGFSSNWGGWVDVADKNVALRYVAANFVVPSVKCINSGYAYFWVGLDGAGSSAVPNNPTVEQAGVAVSCHSTPSGPEPYYQSFWYMYAPKGAGYGHYYGGVSAGDTIAVSVYYDSALDDYSLALNDSNSTAPDFNKPEACPAGYTCHNATAEVIAEDPGGAVAKGYYLANFGTVHFTSVAVTSRSGTHGTLEGNSLWSAQGITMTINGQSNGTVMAQLGARTDGYTAFSDTWKNSG